MNEEAKDDDLSKAKRFPVFLRSLDTPRTLLDVVVTICVECAAFSVSNRKPFNSSRVASLLCMQSRFRRLHRCGMSFFTVMVLIC